MLPILIKTFIEFLYAPIIYPKTLWILIPMIWAILLMELYFDRYSRKGIGHHKSLENTIFLLFISSNLLAIALQHPINIVKLYLSIGFIFFSIVVGLLDFYHKLPTELSFRGSSKFVISFFSYISIILVYSDILNELSSLKLLAVILSIIFLFLTFILIFKLVALFQPKSYEEIEHFLHNIEEDIEKAHNEYNKDEIIEKSKEKKKKTLSKTKKKK